MWPAAILASSSLVLSSQLLTLSALKRACHTCASVPNRRFVNSDLIHASRSCDAADGAAEEPSDLRLGSGGAMRNAISSASCDR